MIIDWFINLLLRHRLIVTILVVAATAAGLRGHQPRAAPLHRASGRAGGHRSSPGDRGDRVSAGPGHDSRSHYGGFSHHRRVASRCRSAPPRHLILPSCIGNRSFDDNQQQFERSACQPPCQLGCTYESRKVLYRCIDKNALHITGD